MDAEAYDKPLPQPDLDTKPFWDGLKNHKLMLQQCGGCGRILSRRSLLKFGGVGLGVAAAGGGLLAACGDDDSATTGGSGGAKESIKAHWVYIGPPDDTAGPTERTAYWKTSRSRVERRWRFWNLPMPGLTICWTVPSCCAPDTTAAR